jgi:hypothetical protein
MTATSPLIETSFADAIVIIAKADELPEQTRRHWATSLRQIAKALDKPLEVIPARYSAVRADLAQLHQVPAGLTAKTLQNHKSNAKSALLKRRPRARRTIDARLGGAADPDRRPLGSLEAVVIHAVLLGR